MARVTDPFGAFRQFERDVFQGVPEQAEPILHSEAHTLVPERHTGRASGTQRRTGIPESAHGTLLTIEFDRTSEEFVYHLPLEPDK